MTTGGAGGEAERKPPNRPPPQGGFNLTIGKDYQNSEREAGHASDTSNGKAMRKYR